MSEDLILNIVAIVCVAAVTIAAFMNFPKG